MALTLSAPLGLADRARLALLGVGAAVAGFALGSAVTLIRERLRAAAPAPAHSTSAHTSSLPWRGRVVLVTGASSGIGRAVAVRLANLGARVCVHYVHNRKAALETVALCGGIASAAVVAADLGAGDSAAAAAALFTSALALFGTLDVLINNAGIYEELDLGAEHEGGAPTLAAFAANWRRTMALNVDAAAALTFAASRYFASHERQQLREGGAASAAIVAVGSRGAFRGEPRAWAYAASKAALHALTASAAQTLGPCGVVCVVVAPGFVETPMARSALLGARGEAIRAQSSWGRVASVDDVAAAVDYAARFFDGPFKTGGIIDVNGASYLRG